MSVNQNAVTILIADDDPDDQLMLREAFRECRLRNPLRFAHDGEELMEILQCRGRHDSTGEPPPGLILLDLNMPRKDGREALREIRADPVLRSIPVLVFTTSNFEDDIAAAWRSGADAFLSKPASFAGLVDMVQTIAQRWLPAASRGPAA
jgi:CheY-like chemotaxis protein